MKRFYKFLMPLVAIVAMALPVNVMAQDSCAITIVGADSYGDGWNGGSLAVMQGSTTLTTFTLTTDSTGSTTVTLASGDTVSFVWTPGSYDEEVSFTIYGPSGEQLYSVATPSTGTVYTLNGLQCPSCIAPTNFTASETDDGVELSWTDENGSSWQIVYGATGFNPETGTNVESASSTSYQLTNLNDGIYDAYVRTDCGSDDYSVWIGPAHFSVGVTIMNMATTGSDTLRSCNAIIYDDGGPTGQYSSNCQSTLVIYPVDNQHAVRISGTSETEGSYDYLTIYSGVGTSGEILFRDNTSGDNSVHTIGPFLTTSAFTVVFHSDNSVTKNGFQINVTCEGLPDCIQPETFVLGNMDATTASFHWTDNSGSAWTIGYGPTGFTLGDDNTQWENFTDTLGTITGLTPNTIYDFYLMAVCTSDSSWTRMITARTACAPLDTLPYVQDFNSCPTGSSNVFDPCWSIYNTYSSNNYPYVTNGYLYMYLTSPSQYGYAMLPLLSDALAEEDVELSFNIWRNSTNTYGSGVVVALFDATSTPDAPVFDTVAVIVPDATTQATAETHYVVISHEMRAGKRIGFFFQNQRTEASSSFYYCYMDNVNLHVAPNCFVPYSFTVNAAQADSVILSWNDTLASNWQVAVGTPGFNPDTVEMPFLVSETELVLDELVGGVSYEAYVRADCGDDQSTWIGPVSFSPGQIIMGITGSATMSVCGAVIYDDGGPNNQYSNNCHYALTLYPSDSTKRFRFWGEGITEGTTDYLRIYAGATASGTQLGIINNSNQILDTVVTQGGPITLLFHSDISIVYAGFEVHVECIDMAACRDIEDVTVHEVSTSSAYITWTNAIGTTPMPNSYIVSVIDTAGVVVNTQTTSEMFAVVGGMSPNSDYTVSVVPACDEANGEPATATLTTAGFGCLQVDQTLAFSDTIGNGTTTSTSLPSYSLYNYGISQQIYTADEIGHGGQIDNVSFMWSTVSQQRTYEIYMGHVTEATASNFLHPADLTLVYNGGPVTMTANQWTTFNLTTPFVYNGTDNLVVIMRDLTGSYVSGNAGYVHAAAAGAARYAYQDSGPYDPFTYVGGNSLSVRNNIVFGGAPCAVQATCAAPLLMVTGKTDHSASIVWAPGDVETEWNVEHKAFTDAAWTVDYTNTTNTSLTVTGLQPNTKYEFRVYHLCGTDTFATVRTVTTDCSGATVPFFEDFAGWNTGSDAAIGGCWFKGTSYGYGYPYVTNGNSMGSDGKSMYFYASGSTYSYLALPKMSVPVDSLVVSGYVYYSSNGYQLNIGVMSDAADFETFQSVSSVSTVSYNWVPFEASFVGMPDGNIAFYVGNDGSYAYLYLDNIEVTYYSSCVRPTNVNDSAVTLNSAVIYWTDTVTSDFEVEYGPVGFQHGQGTADTVNGANNVQITGLTHSTRYDVYVRGLCDNNTGNWSFVHTFATQCGTIDALPFTENFDSWGFGSTVHAPLCWAYGSNYSTSYPYITSVTGHGGAMYMYDGSSAGSANKTWFALPALDSNVAQINQTQVVFSSYKGTSSYQCPVMVGVGNNPLLDTTVVWLDTINPVYNEWNEYEIVFDNYTGTGRHVFFATHVGGSDSYSYPYIDDVILEMIPSCPRPDSLTATNSTTNSVELGWHDRAGASMWQIEYGPRGFQLGTGTPVIANSNPFTLTGLPAAYQGEYYVKAICSSTDTGDYSRRACVFETTQIPATLPYNYDFEDVTEWNNWQTSSNSETNNWFRGSAVADSSTYSMYVSADAGVTYKPYLHNATVNAAVYRDIDFGSIDSSYTLTFRARAGGTIANYYDGLMVFLVDPSLPTIPSTSTITSPWGSVNDLYRIATVRLDTTWQTYEASFDTISGVHRVAFFWFNQNTSGATMGEPAAVDNISIKYSTCPRPVNLAAEPTTNSAMLSWQGPANANYEITYRMVGDTVNQTVIANTNSYNLTGLISPASYLCWVRKLCGEGDTSLYSDGLRFNMLCAPITNFPWYEDFNSYDATGYSTAGSMPNGCWDAFSDGSSEAYLPHVTNGGSTSYQYSPDATNSIVMVSTSSSGSSYGKNVIITLPQFGAPVSSLSFSMWYRYESTSYGVLEVGYMTGVEYPDDFVPVDTLSAISDDGAIDTVTFEGAPATATRIAIRWTNPQTSTWYSVSLDNFEVNAAYVPTCEAPGITSTAVAETTATVNFVSEAALNQVAIIEGNVTAEAFENATTIDVTDTLYTFNGLTASSTYTIGVRAVCSEELISDWVLTQVTTEAHPCYNPTDVVVSDETLTSATISWTPGESIQNDFEVRVYNSTFDETYTVQGNSYTATGLYSATTYNVTVRAVCGEGVYSDWTAAVPFTTADCVAPSNVNATVDGRNVTVSWQSTGADRYRVSYHDEFTPADNATTVEVENGATSVVVTVPEGGMMYNFYVYAYCGDDLSVPSDAKEVEILGIGTVSVSEVTLYPNPASTTVTVSGIEGESTVTVVDMNGRTVYTNTTNSDLTIDLTGMAKGAYFVRITGEQATAVRKLIVK